MLDEIYFSEIEQYCIVDDLIKNDDYFARIKNDVDIQ